MTDKQMRNETQDLDWLAGGGEMSQVIRSIDWSGTPLGPMALWPQSLRTTVSLCLASNFPISIAWGPLHSQIYNDGYWPICGAKHPQSMGQSFRECWASAWPQIGDAFERALGGETSFIENQRMFLDRNGYLEETFFTFSFSPIRDESGRIGGLFHPVIETTSRMITERRTRALRDLAIQAGKAKSIEEACSSLFEKLSEYAFDLPFALLYLRSEDGGQARLVQSIGLAPGLAPELSELISEPFTVPSRWENCGPYPEPPETAVVLPITLPGVEQAFAFFVAGVSSRLPLDNAYRDYLELVAQQIGVAMSNARAYEAEVSRAEKLAQIDRAKTVFFSNISHEFRTPLTLILGPLEELASYGEELPAKARAEVDLAHRNSRRLLRLVNSLLDFSRIEAGRARADFRPTAIGALTRDLASSFRSALEKAGLSYHVSCEESSQDVFIDPDMWEKIVLNLVSNAFKYTFSGHVSVTLAEARNEVRLVVEDSGIGIAELDLPRIFDRFHRVDGARGRTHEGSGIGLALVRELVKLHGGEVTVASIEGRGTTFTVMIPTGNPHPLSPEPLSRTKEQLSPSVSAATYLEEALSWLPDEIATGAGPPPLFSPHILLADDNGDMRAYIAKILSPIATIEAVADGKAALASALVHAPDLILSDVMMPEFDGFDLLRALKANPQTTAIPVILLSARAGEEARIEGLKAGADDYLIKPFSAKELLVRIQTHLHMGRERARMFSIFMQAPIAICILDGPEYIFTLANPMYDELVQRPVLGRKVREAFSPAETGLFFELLDQVYATGKPYIGHETPVPFLDAEGVIRQRVIDFSYHPIRDSLGRITGLLALHIDVTEQVEARARVFESERKFKGLADSMPQMIWTADESGRIDYCNRGFVAFSGVDASAISSWALSTLIHPEDCGGAVEKWELALASGQLFEWEVRIRRRDGVYRWFLVRAVLSKSADDKAGKWFGSCTDVEHQKQLSIDLQLAKNQAENASAVKSRFLANMSHEIRTPLGIILGFSEFLLDPPQNAADWRECVITIRRNAAQLSSLINELLDISKIEADRLEIEKIQFELRGLIQEVEQLMGFHAKEKGIELRFLIEGLIQKNITTDPTRLRQILINIVGNALKFTEKGRVEVRISVDPLTEADPFVRLRFDVMDTGIGLTPEQAERIWEPFVQADSSTTRKFGGTGLGLALSRRLARSLGGELFLSKSESGRGSHFTLIIDAGPWESSIIPSTQESLPSQDLKETIAALPEERLKGAKILLVEDSEDNQVLIKRMLSREGASVDLADNGEEGISMAMRGDYDTVLMDVQMPVLGGYEAVMKLRKRGYQTPIIALTARAMKGEREHAISQGFSDHLSKPVDRKMMIEKIHSYFSSRAD